MNGDLLVLVPVLGRPHRVEPTIASIEATAPGASILFIADPDDEAELAALSAAGAQVLVMAGNYAAKINAGVRHTNEALIFFGADDLDWNPGWLEAARQHVARGVQVVGCNDLCSARSQRGDHATHFLVTREYAVSRTIDGSAGPLYEGYDHSCCDDEFLEVAKYRGVAIVDTSIVVEHLHPDAGKAPNDATYERGRQMFRTDRRHLYSRRHLWT